MSQPIHSMTAFARAEQRSALGLLAIEIRSVNSRHLEASFRLADAVREREFAWRDRLREQVARGKVEISARYEPADSSEAVTINTARVQQLLSALREIDQLAANTAPLNAVDLLRLPGVLITQEVDASALLASADALFAQAMQDFIAMRAREGAALHELVEARLQGIEREVSGVRERLPQILQHFRSKLLARVAEAKADLSAERLEQEVVLFAQKMDVAEEVDRLLAHVTEIRRVLASGGAVGRRLDFLMQELNREANTLGSKSVSADSTLSSVELKVLIEQMREQIQNVE
ncbi:YicC/YloC family endoribonuclease [Perlucidibaca aquatica]|uniref:YicC/YloC family endoribonuclease n=1 Tax=Perlucidibaca aquatica TaxID=1852776 RepID=UPI00083B5170|nr:YicC/YloC family endoribonuclease [Perlucidibaca aquatica]